MRENLKTIFSSYAEVFFLPSGAAGVVIFAVTLVRPGAAAAGILSVLAAYGFARLVKMEKTFLESGYYTYNPLLVGLSLGNLFQFSPLTAFLVAATGVLTFLVTVFTANVFVTYLRLPILSLPFVAVSSLAYLASLRYSNLLLAAHAQTPLWLDEAALPYWVAGFFKALGAVLFVPGITAGVVLSAVLLRYSRILFLLALLGYYAGALVRGLLLGSFYKAFADLNNFNFIFIAMALGGVFLIPSLTSYLLALTGVMIATVVLDAVTGFWSSYGIPAFTLPFNVVTLGMVYVLGLLRHPLVALTLGRTPEETLENYLANRQRYRGHEFTVHLPFAGKWTVWQAWDGPWTHKGSWRYAYDFVITDDQHKTHRGEGTRLEDYYCFHKPVLAPVRGRVVQIIDDLADSPLGGADENNNWGNVVIIQDARGLFVEISHFAERSIRVKKGEWVERGAVLGLCGNSGYSPQPHIHIQVQANDIIGSASVPFSFVSYVQAGEYQANSLPPEKACIEPLYRDKRLDNVTNLVLDDQLRFEVLRGSERIAELKMQVKMAVDGTFYLQSARGQLYFGKHENTFYHYRITGNDPWLRLFFLALPRLPLAAREKLTWQDYVPVGLVTGGLREVVIDFLSSFHPRLGTVKVTQTFSGESRIDSVIEAGWLHPRQTASVQLDRHKGFAWVTVGDITLRRVSDER